MYMYAEESLLTQASVQAPSQRGLTKPVSTHTDHISNSVILSNDYVSLISAFRSSEDVNVITNEAIVLE